MPPPQLRAVLATAGGVAVVDAADVAGVFAAVDVPAEAAGPLASAAAALEAAESRRAESGAGRGGDVDADVARAGADAWCVACSGTASAGAVDGGGLAFPDAHRYVLLRAPRAIEKLVALEHGHRLRLQALLKEREEALAAQKARHETEQRANARQSSSLFGGGHAETMDALVGRQAGEVRALKTDYHKQLQMQQDQQRAQYQMAVMGLADECLEEDHQSGSTQAPLRVLEESRHFNVPTRSVAAAAVAMAAQTGGGGLTETQESIVVYKGGQRRLPFELRIEATEAGPLIARASVDRATFLRQLYCDGGLHGAVLFCNRQLRHADTGAYRVVRRLCSEIPELHFDDLEFQLSSTVQAQAGLLGIGDVVVTRHSNLGTVGALFHAVVSGTEIAPALRSIVAVARGHGVASLTVPLGSVFDCRGGEFVDRFGALCKALLPAVHGSSAEGFPVLRQLVFTVPSADLPAPCLRKARELL